MKKVFSLLLACVLALALLSACGDKPEPDHPVETPPTQTAATGGVDTSCKVYFPNDQASDLRADTVHITDAEATVTVTYAQAIVPTQLPEPLRLTSVLQPLTFMP